MEEPGELLHAAGHSLSFVRLTRRAPGSCRWWLALLTAAGVAALYLIAPVVVGYRGIGERDGPAFYPRGLHEPLYILGHELATGEKPRLSLTSILYDRPLFWGRPARPKSAAEREAILERVADGNGGREATFYRILHAENERIERELAK